MEGEERERGVFVYWARWGRYVKEMALNVVSMTDFENKNIECRRKKNESGLFEALSKVEREFANHGLPRCQRGQPLPHRPHG